MSQPEASRITPLEWGSLSKKSADKAVAYMSQYFATQGWIPQSMVASTS